MVLDKIPMKVFRYFVPSIVHLNNKFWYGGNRWFPYSDDSYWFNGSARGNERIWSHELWRRKVDSGWVFNYREKRKIRVILWRLMSFQTPFLFYEYKIEKLCFLKSIMLVKNERIPTFLKKTLVSESKKSWVITSVPGVAGDGSRDLYNFIRSSLGIFRAHLLLVMWFQKMRFSVWKWHGFRNAA